jgi:hypothetical protein
MRITEEESEISHYSHDEDGLVKRTMVKKSNATLEDIQRALKREIEMQALQRQGSFLEETPRSSMKDRTILKELGYKNLARNDSGTNSHLDDKGIGKSVTFTSRRLRDKLAKNSNYMEEGTVGSDGSDTLYNIKLLKNIEKNAQQDHDRRCETPPDFVDDDIGYDMSKLMGKNIHLQSSLKNLRAKDSFMNLDSIAKLTP